MDCMWFVQREEKVLSHRSSRPRGWMGNVEQVVQEAIEEIPVPTRDESCSTDHGVSGSEQVCGSQRNQTVGSAGNRGWVSACAGQRSFYTQRRKKNIPTKD